LKPGAAIALVTLAMLPPGLACGPGPLGEPVGASTRPSPAEAAREVAARGSIEIVAELVEIPGLEQWDGEFPSNDLGYDYAYVVEYRVVRVLRGEVDGKTLLVAHYNPRKPRHSVADSRCPDVGGTLGRLRVGARHHLALERSIDAHYLGPLIDEYFDETDRRPIHWAVWTDRSDE